MGLFSRKQEASEAARADGASFETVRRSPRNARKRTPIVTDFDAGPAIDPTEATKTRARRRLIGAIALAITAVVLVPKLFNRTPMTPADDIALQIPDRDTPFEGRRGVPDPAKAPLAPTGDLPTSPPATGPVAPPIDAAPAEETSTPPARAVDEPVRPALPPKAAEKAVDRPAEKVADKAAEKKASEKAADKPADKSRAADDPRAIAALEGRSDGAAASASAPAAAAEPGGRSYAVQIAAYASPDKAKGLRDQLSGNGLKSYTESVSTAQGLRTRVRLGPFPTREAADHARAKLKTMKLDGSVVPL